MIRRVLILCMLFLICSLLEAANADDITKNYQEWQSYSVEEFAKLPQEEQQRLWDVLEAAYTAQLEEVRELSKGLVDA